VSRVCLVGVGLIGGSLGLALREAGWEVLGVDPDRASLARALEIGAIDGAVELEEGASRAELAVIATPVEEVIPTCRKLLPALARDALVMDVASTKCAIVQKAEEILPGRFIGGHPMAGSEKGGIDAADPYLFENAPFVLCPGTGVDSKAIARAEELVRKVGAIPIQMTAQEHDEVVGMISHLPHLCAVALLDTLTGLEQKDQAMQLAAGGFRDLTRIASGSPELRRGILGSNRWVVAQLLGELQKSLQKSKEFLEQGDLTGLTAQLAKAKETREKLPARRKGLLGASYELLLSLPDRPGSLAKVTAVLAEAEINIQDLEILRVREGEGGTVKLSFASDQAQQKAAERLRASGFKPVLRHE